MRGAIRMLATAMVVVVAACGQTVVLSPDDGPNAIEPVPGGAVTVTSITTEARPGGIVNVRFENRSLYLYWYNPCQRLVERQEGEAWVQLPPELRICTMEAYDLNSGSSQLESSDVPADATPGTYRFVFQLQSDHAGSAQLSVRSTQFTVR